MTKLYGLKKKGNDNSLKVSTSKDLLIRQEITVTSQWENPGGHHLNH